MVTPCLVLPQKCFMLSVVPLQMFQLFLDDMPWHAMLTACLSPDLRPSAACLVKFKIPYDHMRSTDTHIHSIDME